MVQTMKHKRLFAHANPSRSMPSFNMAPATSQCNFSVLCRALGVPAWLVINLQSLPWQVNVGKPKPSYKPKTAKGKGKQKADGNDDEEGGDMEAILSPAPDLKSNVKEKFPA